MDESTQAENGAIEPALAALLHPDKDTRQRAAVSLGQLADPHLAAQIALLLWQESDFFVRETLTWVLTRTPPPAAAAAAAALATGDTGTRVQALHLLSKLADPDTVSIVARHIDDPDPIVADKARWALARIGDPSSIPLLVDRLGDPDLSSRDAMTNTLTQFGAPAVPSVVSALTAGDANIRSHAAEVLCFIGSPSAKEAIPALIRGLQDEHPDVRLAITLALRELVAHPAARQALSTASFDNPDPRVRAVALTSL
ncbi:MAG: HEAT repeat domain-containing protein [Ornithinimicrobium sp.]